jgi:transcriptional regulator with XRE-family HTH domain
MKINKYFWSYNDKAIIEVGRILKHPENPLFARRAFAILSRTNDIKEVFSIIDRDAFAEKWPEIRNYWIKTSEAPDFRAWWETVYEKLVDKSVPIKKDGNILIFRKIGATIRQARVEKGWTQSDLAHKTGIIQSDISSIELGKKNITLSTLARIAKVLNLTHIELRTTLNIEGPLLEKEAKLVGIHKKTALARLGLQALTARESSKKLAVLGGTERKLEVTNCDFQSFRDGERNFPVKGRKISKSKPN